MNPLNAPGFGDAAPPEDWTEEDVCSICGGMAFECDCCPQCENPEESCTCEHNHQEE